MKKLILGGLLLLFAATKMFGQSHLKNVQVTSVWAPASVKIDGKLNEWEDNFQAYNKSTKLFYTISNNEKYLYLAITCTDPQNNTKIAAGGITLLINTEGKKKEKDAFSITYPVISSSGSGRRGRGGFRQQQTGGTDTAAVNAARRQFIASSKEIKVFGFKDVEDTLISIYNEYGIKTGISYDTLGNYNYELAIPLRLLGLTSGDAREIAYDIKVNGLQIKSSDQMKVMADNFQGGGGVNISGMGGGGRSRRDGGGAVGEKKDINSNFDFEDMTSPTDFWGKYTLAKK